MWVWYGWGTNAMQHCSKAPNQTPDTFKNRHLIESANYTLAVDVYFSFEGLQFTGQDLQKGTLARTVGSNDGNATVQVHTKLEIFEQKLVLLVSKAWTVAIVRAIMSAQGSRSGRRGTRAGEAAGGAGSSVSKSTKRTKWAVLLPPHCESDDQTR